jgi:hypothetical protein
MKKLNLFGSVVRGLFIVARTRMYIPIGIYKRSREPIARSANYRSQSTRLICLFSDQSESMRNSCGRLMSAGCYSG